MRILLPKMVIIRLILCMILGKGLKLVKGHRSLVSPMRMTENMVEKFPSTTFTDSFRVLWGEWNIAIEEGGATVRIKLDKYSGAGFKSQKCYTHGFLNAAIKLPDGYSAGIVTAFYTSNADMYPKSHDELDFEFLGIVPGENHGLQTNIYLNGSTGTGREERLNLWFDPTADFHNYSILWDQRRIVFFVDNVPIRALAKNRNTWADYPTRPTSIYATIWDGSAWATDGGKYPVDYSKGPFEAIFKHFRLEGCEWDANRISARCSSSSDYIQRGAYQTMKTTLRDTSYGLTSDQMEGLEWVRKKHLTYSYCFDTKRYPIPLPECRASTST